MHPLSPELVDAHAAETRERLLACTRPRRSPRHRRSPWALLRRIGDVVAGRWVTSRWQGEKVKSAHDRVLEA